MYNVGFVAARVTKCKGPSHSDQRFVIAATGASKCTGIMRTGAQWEIGLAEDPPDTLC